MTELNLTGRKKLKEKISILSLHLNVGGIEKAICDQANMLSEKYNVEIITLYKMNNTIPFKLNKNVKVIYLSKVKPNKEEFKKYLKEKDLINTFKEGIKAIKILYLKKQLMAEYIYNSDSKIIISTRLYFTKLLNKYKNPEAITIAEEHVYHHESKKYFRKLDKALKNIDYLLPASKYLTIDYKKKLKTNTTIDYIPLTINYFPEKISKLEKNNIIAVGRLEPEKGFEDLIDIMSKVIKKNKNLRLTIIGDGSQRNKIETKIKSLKLEKNITITGYLTQEQIKKYYQKASLLINTSYEESFGLVLIEAASYGIPSIAFSCALGAKEIIDNKYGIIIDNRDLNKMSDQVTKILGGNESSKLIGDMVQTIGSELQSQTLEGGKLSEQIKSIADKVSDAYINGTKKTTNKEIEELYQNTQKFANNFTNQPLNVNMINNMLKQYGIDKTLTEDDINKACQQMGIKKDQLNNVMQNSNQGMNRKTRRIIQQSTDKNGNIHIKPKTQFKTKRK